MGNCGVALACGRLLVSVNGRGGGGLRGGWVGYRGCALGNRRDSCRLRGLGVKGGRTGGCLGTLLGCWTVGCC